MMIVLQEKEEMEKETGDTTKVAIVNGQVV